MQIRGLTPFSLIDYPGKISAVIFTGGCNLRCPFCHNPGLVNNNSKLPIISEDHLITFLNSRSSKIEGVVITGGEPTIHNELSDLILKIKRLGFFVKLDTNGSNPNIIGSIIDGGLLDYVALDLKTSFSSRYQEYFGFRKVNDLVLSVKETIKILLKSPVTFEFRTTLVPGLHDELIIKELAKGLKELIDQSLPKALPKWYLQNFRPGDLLNPSFNTALPFTEKRLSEFLEIAREFIPSAQLRSYY